MPSFDRGCLSNWIRACTRAFMLSWLGGWPGCTGPQSLFEASGTEAAGILELWWILLGSASVAVLAVFAYLLLGIARSAKRDALPVEERRLTRIFYSGIGVTTLLLFVALIPVFMHSTGRDPIQTPMPEVEVVGKRWWWSIRYLDREGKVLFETANELHLPLGKRFRLRLTSTDIIHSFWVPALAGKMDLIPGHTNYLELEATAPGRYRGQCAEYCGLQHALMAFWVVVHPPDEYAAWLRAQREPARPAEDSVARQGQSIFRDSTCASCHRIRGVSEPALPEDAYARGPDLTHLMSRSTIAAGTLPNTKGHLAAWIADPQALKPGNFMPQTLLPSEQFLALLHYLESLE